MVEKNEESGLEITQVIVDLPRHQMLEEYYRLEAEREWLKKNKPATENDIKRLEEKLDTILKRIGE